MNIGFLYTFKYKSSRKPFDPNPIIIYLGKTNKKIIGINLNFISKRFQSQIIKYVNNELIKTGNISQENIDNILATNKEIEENQFFELLIMANDKVSLKDQKIKSVIRLNKILKSGFRVYNIDNIENKITPFDYK